MSMADLLAKQDNKFLKLTRNQEVTGTVIDITTTEIILDLGSKAEGVLPKKDLAEKELTELKAGSKIDVFVVIPENESGQALVTTQQASPKNLSGGAKWRQFESAQEANTPLTGRALEVNKGGLIVEVMGVRGFLPSSQVALSQASDLSKLIGQDINVSVIEVDSDQNRLIFSQKTILTEDIKAKLTNLKIGDRVSGKVAAVLPFGIFVAISGDENEGVEGLVHASEISWDRVEEPASQFSVGQEVEAKVISVDPDTGRVNLSIRQLTKDPFVDQAEKYSSDDVVKGTVTKVNNTGVYVELEKGLEGLIQSPKIEADTKYEVGQEVTVLIDSVDTQKRRILLSPFRTSTKDLIYK